MENKYNVTIGSDPELFLIDKSINKIISSIGIIPGTKENPYIPEELPKGFAMEIDNILAEFNIPPCTTAEDFVNSMETMKDYIRSYVKNINPNYDLLHVASAEIPEDQLTTPEAKLFGCSVDYNAYTGEPNPKPEGETTNLRSSGCHIHIGYSNNNIKESLRLVKYMDAYVGIPSVLIDKDTKRRELYGKAGCFRLTSFGVEYRVLSGLFISSTELEYWMFKQTMKAVEAWANSTDIPRSSTVVSVINKGRVDRAKELCDTFNLI